MKCPKCGEKAIGFAKWCQGVNAFTTDCESCGVTLRGNKVTMWGFILTLVVMIPIILVVALNYDESMGSEKFWRFGIVVIPAIVGGVIVFAKGGYVPKDE